MRTRTLFLALLFLPFAATAQSLQLDWSLKGGGDSTDLAYAIAVDDSGNVYYAGYYTGTASLDPSGGSSFTSSGGRDAFLAKFDSSGTYQWAIDMKGGGDDQITALVLDGNGHPVVAGDFEQDLDLNGQTFLGFGNSDMFLAKYDGSGNLTWSGQLGGSNPEYATSLALDPSGDIFLTGYFAGTSDFDPSSGSSADLTSYGSADAFLAKYDPSGNYLNAEKLGGPDNDYGASVATDGNGNAYLTGFFKGTAEFDPSGSSSTLTSGGSRDVFVAKYNASIGLSWVKRMGGNDDDVGRSIESDSSGLVSLTGSFKGDIDLKPSSGGFGPYTSKGQNDIFVAGFSANGNIFMGNTMGGSGDDIGNGVERDPSGNTHITGTFEGTVDFGSFNHSKKLSSSTGPNIFIAKYGPYGNFGRAVDLEGDSFSYASSMILRESDEALHLAGGFADTLDTDPTSTDNSLIATGSKGNPDAFLSKYQTPPCTTDLTLNVSDVSCAGNSDGKAEANMSGGTAPYTYIWSGGDSTNTVDSLSAGTYLLSARSSEGCIETEIFEVQEPPALSVSLSGQDATCNGVDDGKVTASPSGGTSPYSYQWSNGDTTATIDSLPAGTYSVTVTDSNGCQSSASTTIGTQTSVSLSTSVTDAECGKANGSASVSASGGTSPYSYIWSSGDTTATADSLAAGTYTVQVTDDIGCEAYASVNVNNSSGVTASINGLTHVTCPGDSTGAIDISVSGGTTPYEYQWSNGATSQDLSNIPAGTYQVEVMDADSCKSIVKADVTEPSPLQLSTSTVNANCGASDGEASVSVSGGTQPYSYQWSSGGSSATDSGLAAGTYSVTVVDSNGCMDSATASISENGGPSVTIDNISNTGCAGTDGSIFLTVTGGSTPYDFMWSNGDTTEDLTGVGPGSYTLTVTDSAGCQAVIDTTIGTTIPQVPICVVSVDSSSEHNLVIWENLPDPSVKAYNIYKEGVTAGSYSKIGTVQDSALSTFIDTNSDPEAQAYRYKISTVDSCGNESALSPKHKTLHLTVNKGVNNKINLIWDDYIGFAYPTFYIHRYTDSTGWKKIDSLASSDHSYTDANAPAVQSLRYKVSVRVPSGGCTATRAKDYNKSISNASLVPNDTSSTQDSTSFIQNQESSHGIELYPNPTRGRFTIEWKELEPRSVAVHNIQGRIVREVKAHKDGSGPGGSMTIDLSNSEPGIYWIRIEGKNKTAKRPVVVE